MELIATSLGDHNYLCSASHGHAATRIVRFDLEFLDTLHGRGDSAFRPSAKRPKIVGVTGNRVGDLAAIKQKRILVTPRSSHLATKTARLKRGRGLLRHGERL